MKFDWSGAVIFFAIGITAISVPAGIVALVDGHHGVALAAGLVAAVALAAAGGVQE